MPAFMKTTNDQAGDRQNSTSRRKCPPLLKTSGQVLPPIGLARRQNDRPLPLQTCKTRSMAPNRSAEERACPAGSGGALAFRSRILSLPTLALIATAVVGGALG